MIVRGEGQDHERGGAGSHEEEGQDHERGEAGS